MVELNLTKRQQEIFDYVKRYVGEHGYPPTVRDIGKAIGLTSSSTVHAHLANLEKAGPAAARPDQAAGDRGARRQGASSRSRRAGCRVVGQVAAGAPMLAEENIEEYVAVPGIAGGDEGEFVLRVKGDSMKDAGILDGDHVVVRRQETRGRRRDRRGPRRRRGHRQALLQGVRPRPAPARERGAGADPDRRRPGARAGGRCLQEGVMSRRAGQHRGGAFARAGTDAAGGGGLTLEQLLEGAGEGLRGRGGGVPGLPATMRMEARGARCGGCGTRLPRPRAGRQEPRGPSSGSRPGGGAARTGHAAAACWLQSTRSRSHVA